VGVVLEADHADLVEYSRELLLLKILFDHETLECVFLVYFKGLAIQAHYYPGDGLQMALQV
jgi:hypothetical protein